MEGSTQLRQTARNQIESWENSAEDERAPEPLSGPTGPFLYSWEWFCHGSGAQWETQSLNNIQLIQPVAVRENLEYRCAIQGGKNSGTVKPNPLRGGAESRGSPTQTAGLPRTTVVCFPRQGILVFS